MASRLRQFAPVLRKLSKATSKKSKLLLKQANNDLIKCLCDCSKNILNGNVNLSPRQKKRLVRHKHNLRKIVNKKTSLKAKRKIIQKGGFLGALLGPIVSVLGNLFGGARPSNG